VTQRAAKHPIFATRLAQARERAPIPDAVGCARRLGSRCGEPRINQYERGKHEPQLKTAKRLAEVLGIPPAFLYTEDELLAKLLLRWNELTVKQKKDLLKQVEPATAPRAKRAPCKAE
jgi:transcriptional regulator with XRE-family HTH domain